MKSILYIAGIVLFVCCNESELMTYQGSNELSLSYGYKDTLDFFFALHPGKETWRLGIPVRLSGYVVSSDRVYFASVVDTMTTAEVGVHYVPFQEKQIFRGSLAKDSLFVLVKRTPDLEEKSVTLGIAIYSSDDFVVSSKTNNRTIIRFTAQVARPEWWNLWHERYGLGIYSKKKYELFMEVTGESDLDYMNREDLSFSEMRALVLQFKYWLFDHPQIDEDGSAMRVKVVG